MTQTLQARAAEAVERLLSQSPCDRTFTAALITELAAALSVWKDAANAPEGHWLITHRSGERGYNITALRVSPDGDREWVDTAGRTTVTHSTFGPPTHFLSGVVPPAPPPPEEAGG